MLCTQFNFTPCLYPGRLREPCLFSLCAVRMICNEFNEVGSWLPGKEKSALLVFSLTMDITGKGGLMEEHF